MTAELASDEIELLRACFVGDPVKWEAAFGEAVDSSGGPERPAVLMSALLVELARRTFDSDAGRSGVVGFVASVRVRERDGDGEIDPEYAENLLLAALGREEGSRMASESSVGDDRKLRIQLALTCGLAEDLSLGSEARQELLQDVAAAASRA